MLASIALAVVDGAVKTSVVCFVEAPRELEANHLELYSCMTSAHEEQEERRPIVDNVVAVTSSGRTGSGRSVSAVELT